MATTFLQLQAEFYARGHNFLTESAEGIVRAKRWINQAYEKVCSEELWPFRLATATGAAPLTIADVDKILSVINTANASMELIEATERELTIANLSTTGVPYVYWLDGTIVKTWPVGGTLSVRYFKVPAEFSADGDVMLVPDRFADVIIDDAVRRAAKDRQYQEGVALAAQEYADGLEMMRRQLLTAPTKIRRMPWVHEDYGA